LPWQKAPIPNKIQANFSLLVSLYINITHNALIFFCFLYEQQKLREPLLESKKQQDENEFKQLASTLLNSNSNIERLISLYPP
jgi:hypothetical protein